MAADHTPTLEAACSQEGLLSEDWSPELIAMVADPRASNRDLLAATSLAARGLGPNDVQAWRDDLIEYSLWETGRIPERLGLCAYLVSIGAGRVSSPARWRSFGGLLHIACEAGSIAGIQWALEREPSSIRRPGGRLGISPFHALQMNDSDEVALAAVKLLSSAGADINAVSADGRNALFRCSSAAVAELMIDLGADPEQLDAKGFSPLGLWIELGFWPAARKAFASRPALIDGMLPWGSMSRSLSVPLFDRPFFIAACASAGMRTHWVDERQILLDGIVSLGANPTLLDARGRSAHERSACPMVLAHMEQWILSGESSGGSRAGAHRL